MKQHEAVIKVMEDNGGYATLGLLYQGVPKIEECAWKTKTPFASIRRIVQDDRFFFKIKPGLWALKSYKKKLPFDVLPEGKEAAHKKEEFNHTYYQGLLVEIGNLRRLATFVPNQDKNKPFLGKKLGEVATVEKFYEFTYDRILKKARTIDVTWFNIRKMPHQFFEVEHSTDINNSLLKFVELQDFNAKFWIVAHEAREREFKMKRDLEAFKPIKKRISFLGYEKLSEWHTKTHEITSLERLLTI